MKQYSNKRYIAIGLMLFALFFGAGNLIFPASMGQNAGQNVWWAVIGVCITGVGMPLLSVMAMGYSGCSDLQEAAGRVHPLYGLFFTVVAYMAIGPCFAIPRTGTVAYEIAMLPFLDKQYAEIGRHRFDGILSASCKYHVRYASPSCLHSSIYKDIPVLPCLIKRGIQIALLTKV